jgi:hypothetical protein
MATFTNSVYSSCDEVLDGKEYHACEFQNCQLIYRGGEVPILDGCRFAGCKWRFDDSAGRTLGFLSAMYHGGLKKDVEEILDAIRNRPAGAK